MCADEGYLERGIREATSEVKQVNLDNGWYDSDRSFGDGIALLHSEVSEAFEAFRKWGLTDKTAKPNVRLEPSKPEGVGSEMADIFIRLLDECDRQGINLVSEYCRKIAYNRTRGYHHGGKAV